MLPEINRLKSNDDFEKIFRCGKTSENEFIRIKFLKNQKKYSRFGFIINNKFAPKAVVRNLFKRRLRAATRFLLGRIKPGFDVVIWPKTASKKSDYQILLNNFKNLLAKNDILSI